MTAGNWITVAMFGIGLVLAGLGAYYTLHGRVGKIENRCENNQKIIDSIAYLNSRLDKIAADNETFWRILGPAMADIIHSPTAHDRDALVEKLVGGHITVSECRILMGLLREAIGSNRWTGDKRVAGALLLARTKATLDDLDAADEIDSRRRP